jgi:TonB family protein
MSEKKNGSRRTAIILIICVVTFFGGGIGFGLKFLSGEKMVKRERRVQMVNLLRPVTPPPPPKIKEQPPEQQPKQQEEVMEETNADATPDNAPEDADAPPAGELLGLDADGGAGSDSFGLVGKKGGRSILSGGGGSNREALLRKYAWYTRILREELERLVRQHLENSNGIPEGELETVVRLRLDDTGGITSYSLVASSGNDKMDEAVQATLKQASLNEPPPQDMPRIVKLKIVSKG